MSDKDKVVILRKALGDLLGSSDDTELRAMELTIRLMNVPERDRTISLNAIHAMLETEGIEDGRN